MTNARDEKLYELMNKTFKDLTLCMGGLVITHRVRDEIVCDIADAIANIYFRTMGRLEDILGMGLVFDHDYNFDEVHPHPEIEQLLKIINFKPVRKEPKKEGG